ncbi:MAG: hypothetical protein ABI275_07395 [Terrimesophilobacter sp.]
MPTESELREWLHGDGSEPPAHRGLDIGQIIRRSKRRRLPRQVGAGGVMTLAVAGIAVGGVTGLKAFFPGASTTSGASQSLDRGGSELAPAQDSGAGTPAPRLARCGRPVASVPPNSFGLVLTPQFPSSAPANGEPVTGTVTLTNTGTATVTGSTAAAAAIMASQQGIVLWHSNGPTILLAKTVDLAPGQSVEYPASFTPVRCAAGDDTAEGFPNHLPSLGAGDYQVSALIEVNHDSAMTLVGGQPVTIRLR